MAAVIRDEPPPLAAPDRQVPLALERVVRHCLEKKPAARFQSAVDLVFALEEAAARGEVLPSKRRHARSWQALGIILAGAAGAIAGLAWHAGDRADTSHVTIALSANGLTATTGGVALSPDGRTLVFAAHDGDGDPRLYMRRLDRPEVTPLEGTERGGVPFFSPDGKWLAFVADGRLAKVSIDGGHAQTICPTALQGASRGYWGSDNRIIFTRWPGGLSEVSADGGSPRYLLQEAGANHIWPQALPDGMILFTQMKGGRTSLVALRRDGELRVVKADASCARYLRSGHLVYESAGRLHAVGFDARTLTFRGGSRVVLQDAAVGQLATHNYVDYDVSASGSLVALPQAILLSRLVWRDRHGATVPLDFRERNYSFPSLSFDGRQLTVSVARWPTTGVFIASADGEPMTGVPAPGPSMCSLFSRDGQWLAFSAATAAGWSNLHRIRTDLRGSPEALTGSPHNQKPTSWSPDGTRLLFNNQADDLTRDIGSWSADRPGEWRAVVATPNNELEAMLSPDGRWMAYQSDESGQWEVYVEGPGGRRQVSVDGGIGPVWNTRGDELFYQTQRALMAVRIQDGGASGAPVRLFGCRKLEDYRREYDAAPGGDRFLFLEPATARTEINVVLNWFEELKAKVPRQ